MIKVSMRQQYFLNNPAIPADHCKKLFRLCARINEKTVLCFIINIEKAIFGNISEYFSLFNHIFTPALSDIAQYICMN